MLVGAGGLGSPAALYLAAAGVGKIGLADGDVVDFTNLQRQILYSLDDLGRSKVAVAGARLAGLNGHTRVETYFLRLDEANAGEIVSQYDLVVDCTDAVATRYLLMPPPPLFVIWLDNNGKAFGKGPYELLLRVRLVYPIYAVAVDFPI